MKHLITLLLCAALLAGLCACGAPKNEPEPETAPEPGPVSLWYVKEEPLTALFTALSEHLPEAQLTVRSFDSELLLAAELDRQVPDLLVCGYGHASGFHNNGMLTDLSESCAELCPALLRQDLPCAGRTFFPLMADAWVLYANAAQYEAATGQQLRPEDLATISRFCSAADDYTASSGLPFYTADSFAPLFAVCLAQSGSEFHAERAQDLTNEAYTPLYNQLAENAYADALQIFSGTDALSLTEQGKVVCSFQPAAALSRPAEGCLVLPLPQHSKKTPVMCSLLTGIAVTGPEEKAARCAQVLQTLFSLPQAADLLLGAGKVPFAGTAQPPDNGDTASLLWNMRSSYRFSIIDPDSDYLENSGRFDALFRAAMQQLNGAGS